MGYGTASEAVAHKKPFVYIRRDFFNEQSFLVKLLASHGLVHELRRDEFYAGRWGPKLEQAYASSRREGALTSPTPRRVDCRGGEVVAQVLVQEGGRGTISNCHIHHNGADRQGAKPSRRPGSGRACSK